MDFKVCVHKTTLEYAWTQDATVSFLFIPAEVAKKEEIFDEIIRQQELISTDEGIFFSYAQEYTQSCIENVTLLTSLSNCSKSVIEYLDQLYKINITATRINDDHLIKEKILNGQLFSRKFIGDSNSPLHININRMELKGKVLQRSFLDAVCSGIEPQPSECRENTISKIISQTEEQFHTRDKYPYASLSIYFTVALTLIFIFYILALLVLQNLFSNGTVPSYMPMSILIE